MDTTQEVSKTSCLNFLSGIIVILLMLIIYACPSFAGQPVRMAYLQNDIHHLALWVALEKGLYEKEGVEVEITGVFRAGPEIMTAFTAEELDMAYVGEAPTTVAAANGAAKVAAVAQVNTEGSAIVVRKKSTDLARVADLKGKTIAIPGHSTVQDFLLLKALTQNKLDLKAVNIIVIKPPEMITALGSNQIDAFIAWEPYPSKADSMGIGRNLVTSHDIWEDHPCCVLVADTGFMAAHPTKVKKIVQAHIQANDFISTHPEEAVDIGVKYTGMDGKTIQTAMKTVHYTEKLSIDGEMEYINFLTSVGYIKIKDRQAFLDNLLNQTFLEE
jgi:NitT/TauT family transport system substrate-binding protein